LGVVDELTPHSQGIGRFAIYDEAQVEEADLGVNFFLDDSCLGKSRSQSLTELITELNPDVQGSWYPNEVGR
jgi:amyloid beta precursor protein binding protein 1